MYHCNHFVLFCGIEIFSCFILKDGSVWRTNKFMDVCQYPMGSSPDMRIWERRLLYCVPVSFSFQAILNGIYSETG